MLLEKEFLQLNLIDLVTKSNEVGRFLYNKMNQIILYLVYFWAIQSEYYSTNPLEVADIIEFEDILCDKTIFFIFSKLNNCRIKENGGNNYKQPDMPEDR